MPQPQPKRYRLLKDLPGCPKGTVFFPDDFAPHRPPGYRPEHLAAPFFFAVDVENDRSFFDPITEPERPYPWELKKGDRYFTWEEPSVVWQSCDMPGDRECIAKGMAYRTKEDAELRLKAEPLINAAVKALINQRSLVPVLGERFWSLTDAFEPGFKYEVRQYIWNEDESDTFRRNRASFFGHADDARAMADLFNFLLTTHPDA